MFVNRYGSRVFVRSANKQPAVTTSSVSTVAIAAPIIPCDGTSATLAATLADERKRRDAKVRALAVPPDHLVCQRVVEEEQRQRQRRARRRPARHNRTARRTRRSRSSDEAARQSAASTTPAIVSASTDPLHQSRVGRLHQQRERHGHHRGRQQSHGLDQPEHGVVRAHRLEPVPALDEEQIDAEVEGGEQHARAEREDVAQEDGRCQEPFARVPSRGFLRGSERGFLT